MGQIRVVHGPLFCVALLVVILLCPASTAQAQSAQPLVEPGGAVSLPMGQVRTGSWLTQPLWRATQVRVLPQPVTAPGGEPLAWTASDVKTNASGVSFEGGWHGSFDKDNGTPLIRSHDVQVEFTLNNDRRLLGKMLSAHVQVVVQYVAEDARGALTTQTFDKDLTFQVSTAEEIRAYNLARIKFVAFLAGGIAAFLGIAALIMRVTSRPATGLMKHLNDWRQSQMDRLGPKSIVCPHCKTTTNLQPVCAQCGKTLLKGRVLSRVLLLVIPALIILMIGYACSNAGMIYYAMKNIAAWGTGGVLVIIVLASMIRSAFNDMSKGIGGFASALLLPATAREKYARLAARLLPDQAVSDDEKARAVGFALCQPFSSLTEFHAINPTCQSCGVSFWKEKRGANEVTPSTHEVLDDLVFVENLQLCLASNSYLLSADPRIDTMIALATDSPRLLEAANLVRSEAATNEWLRKLLDKVSAGINGHAPALAAILRNEKAP